MAGRNIPFPTFTPGDRSDLMAWLHLLPCEEPPGSVERGCRVFSEKQCAVCPRAEAPDVPTIGPHLAKLGLDRPFEMHAQTWNPPPAIEKRMQQGKIRWPLLDKDPMRDLIAYVLFASQER